MIPDPLHPELVRLDRMYQQTCLAFENGEISAAEARARILNLTYKDPEGRIWCIDTKRSGRRAAFTDEVAGPIVPSTRLILAVPPPASISPASVDPTAVTQISAPNRQIADQVSDSRHRLATVRRQRLQIFAKVAVVVIMLVASLAILFVENEPAATVPVTPISVSTTQAPVIPQAVNIATFSTRGEVPFNIDIEFGRSVRDIPLLVHRRGIPDGVCVLVIGVIHGDESASLADHTSAN